VSDARHDRLELEAGMIDTKKEMIRAEIAEAEGRDVPVGVVFSLIDEIERLAKICEQLQFGGRPDCPECFTASTNYDPVKRDWFCGPCDNGGE
jgi:hypothetical protein